MYNYKSLQAGQLPWEHLPFLQNLLNFIIVRNLKQEVHDNLNIRTYACDLSISGDIKSYQCHMIKR